MFLKNSNEQWKKIKSSQMVFSKFGKKDKDDYSYVIIPLLDVQGKGLAQDQNYAKYFSYYNSAPVSVFVVPEGTENSIDVFT
jgi:hypothetical protein